MEKTTQGVIRGRTIELSEETGLADGQKVEVVLRTVDARPWGEGIRRSAGAAADVSGFDEAFAQVERDRKSPPQF